MEGAADGSKPVGHALQAGAVGGSGGVETGSIVGDRELKMAVGAGQRDSGLRGPGVLGHVLQRLQDAEVRGGLGVAPVAPDSVRLDQTGSGARRAWASTAAASPWSASSGG